MPEFTPAIRIALPAIRVASHRAFRDEAVLRLGRLTLLYGRNQAGKSTLLRLLPLLGDSLVERRGPLDMTSPALRGDTFKELGWLGPGYEATQRLAFLAGANQSSPLLLLDVVDDGAGPFVNRVTARSASDEPLFDVRLSAKSENASRPWHHTYAGHLGGAPWEEDLEFSSLLPHKLPGAAGGVLDDVRAALRPLERLQWLQTSRLGGFGAGNSRPCRCCAPDGADLPILLQSAPQVLKLASEWLSRDEVGIGALRIGRDQRGQPIFELKPRSGWEHLPLALAGEGLRALLPILLCAAWADSGSKAGPSMLAVEEPEAQLHPRLQVALFDKLVQSIRNGLPVVVETHSLYVLLSMQRAVLKGLLQPGDVALYWVEQGDDGASNIRQIEVTGDATLGTGWPPGVFEEEQELAREILNARWAKEETT